VSYQPFAADLSQRVALVTGANRGMGKETARELARMGATVVLGCRSRGRGEAAANEIQRTTGRDASVAAQTPLDGADTSIWLAARPDAEGLNGGFWSKRREVRCRFRDPAAVAELSRLVEQQLAGRPIGSAYEERTSSRP
jgi:NAD(P)-dependent dehydrogenase (short-subunit alcohol dehydrogenase family)